MKVLTLEMTADYLESATIEKTVDFGHAIVHQGVSDSGFKFVLINDVHGESVVSESV